MPKSKMPLSSPDDTEQAFYEALLHADIERLMACWADEDDIVCIHPGGPRLFGHAAVRAAFEAIFANGGLKVHAERVKRLDAGATSVHSLIERIELIGEEGPHNAWVVATNIYAKTVHGWRMIAHHANSSTRTEPVDVELLNQVLH